MRDMREHDGRGGRGVFIRVLVSLLCVMLACGMTHTQVQASGQTGTTREARAGDAWLAEIPVASLSERLAQLTPARPLEYFLLAEEVASEAKTRAARQLARELYVLAMRLDQRASGGRLTPSCLRGLTTVAADDRQRAWFAATARVAEQTTLNTGSVVKQRLALLEPTDQAAFDLATALGFARTGDGRRAESLLARPGVGQILDAYENVLNADGQINAGQLLRKWMRDYPSCPECRNRRVINRTDGPGTPVRSRLCGTCLGMPGPEMSEAELIAQLRTESSLLRGIHRFWSSQYLVDNGEPLRDPTPEAVAQVLNISEATPFFRNGLWTATEK